MQRALLTTISILCMTSLLTASSYRASQGSFAGPGFLSQVAHEDIWNILRTTPSDKVRFRHATRSEFRLRASAGYLLMGGCTVTILGKHTEFIDPAGRGIRYASRSGGLRFPGHVKSLLLEVRVKNMKSGRIRRFRERLQIAPLYSPPPGQFLKTSWLRIDVVK